MRVFEGGAVGLRAYNRSSRNGLGRGACIKVKSPLSKRLAKARCITVSGSGWFWEPVRKGFRATSCLADEALAPDLGYASRVSAC